MSDAVDPPVGSPSKPADVKLEGEELNAALTKQLEFYMSEQNLVQDAYLTSKMDAQMFVDIDVIASFPRVQKLTSDPALILEVLRSSNQVVVDAEGGKVRPNISIKRHTLIIRDLPSATPEDDVKKLLSGEEWPEIQTIRAEIGDNWFVTFVDEEATMKALDLARSVTWNGDALKVRVKSESVLKSSAYMQRNTQPIYHMGGMYTLPPNARMWDTDRRGGRAGRRGGRGGAIGAPAMQMDMGGRGGAQQAKRARRKGREGRDAAAPSFSPQQFPPLPSKADPRNGSMPNAVYSLEEMRDMFLKMPAIRPANVDADCPVVLTVPDTLMEINRPESDRRFSIDLDKKYARQKGSLGAAPDGIEEDVLAEALAAVADVEAEEAARAEMEALDVKREDVSEGGEDSPGTRSYASLLKGH